MKLIGIVQIVLLTVLTIEGGLLILQLSGDVMPVMANEDCHYDELSLYINSDSDAATPDAAMERYAAMKKRVTDMFAKANVAATLRNDSLTISSRAAPESDDSQPSGLLGNVAKAFVPDVAGDVMVNGALEYTFADRAKALEAMKLLVSNGISVELRVSKGDTCRNKAATADAIESTVTVK